MNTEEVIQKWRAAGYDTMLNNKGYYSSLRNTKEHIMTKARAHDEKFLMRRGCRLPGTKLHAAIWVREGLRFDVISVHEIMQISDYCKMLNFTPEFKFTKSKGFVRVANPEELTRAISNYWLP